MKNNWDSFTFISSISRGWWRNSFKEVTWMMKKMKMTMSTTKKIKKKNKSKEDID